MRSGRSQRGTSEGVEWGGGGNERRSSRRGRSKGGGVGGGESEGAESEGENQRYNLEQKISKFFSYSAKISLFRVISFHFIPFRYTK
jgi:hypothetical protein